MTTVRKDHIELALATIAEAPVTGQAEEQFLARMEMELSTEKLTVGQLLYCNRVWREARHRLMGAEGEVPGWL